MARRIRIAVSVFFAVLTVALCMLWVRSYWVSDRLTSNYGVYNSIEANVGYLRLFRCRSLGAEFSLSGWQVKSLPANADLTRRWRMDGDITLFTAPIWTAIIASIVGATLPFARIARFQCARFSLRTLLIATTLVAIVLGLAVWAGQ